MSKTEQLQIRVTRAEKNRLRRLAQAAGQDVSAYVLSRVLPAPAANFHTLLRSFGRADDYRYPLAELNDLLAGLSSGQLPDAVAAVPPEFRELTPFLQNYVAAMVEQTCNQRAAEPPAWTTEVLPLAVPWFATPLRSLRLHLLTASPLAFKRRNIFIDASVGDRV